MIPSIAEVYEPPKDCLRGTMELNPELLAERQSCAECGGPEGQFRLNSTLSLIDTLKGKKFFCDSCWFALSKLLGAIPPIRADLYATELNALYVKLKSIAALGEDRYQKR